MTDPETRSDPKGQGLGAMNYGSYLAPDELLAFQRTGGTLGAKYLQRTVDLRFFPRLWVVRASVYGEPS